MANVLILAWGTGGDVFPFIQIGKALKARGHQVTLLSSRGFERLATGIGLSFAPLDTSGQFEKWAEKVPGLEALQNLTEASSKQHASIYVSLFETIKERWSPGETILIGHYDLQLALQLAAEKLQTPSLTVYIAPYFVTNAPCAELIYKTTDTQINRIRAELDLPPVQDAHSRLNVPQYSIGLWPEWFAVPDHSWPPGLVPVGFVWSEEMNTGDVPEDVKQIKESGQIPILLSHGTSTPSHPKFFSASLEACELNGYQPILVTEWDVPIPGSLVGKARRYEYLPFGSLMPHVAAVIHHGGIGTCAQSLAAGIPQIVLGQKYDRPDNGARLQRLGVAESLPLAQWKGGRIAEALERLLGSADVAARCQYLARRINDNSAAAKACRVIETLARESGADGGAERTKIGGDMEEQHNPQKQDELSVRLAQLSPAKQALLEKRRQGRFLGIPRNIQASPIKRVSRDGELPLTFLLEHQLEQLWSDPLVDEICSRCYRLTGTLDESAMTRTVNELARRHEILRTRFPLENGRVKQVITPTVNMDLPVIDLQHVREGERMDEALRIVAEKTQRSYDLSRDPLWRVLLLRLGENDHLLVLNMSHFISDGWSWELLVRECWTLYRAFSTGKTSPLTEPPIQFADYAYWQRNTLRGQVLENLTSYWNRQLKGLKLIPEIHLPIERPLPTNASRSALTAAVTFQYVRITPELLDSLKQLGRREGVTLYMILFAALVTILHRYTGGTDLGIPTPVTKRNRQEVAEVFGPFADIFVLRTRLSGIETFSGLLRHVRDVVLEAYEHQDLPFILFPGNTDEMWKDIDYPSIRFNMQKGQEICGEEESRDEARIPGLATKLINIPPQIDETWKVPDFLVHVQDDNSELTVAVVYERERFVEPSIMEFLENYLVILKTAITRSEQRLSEFPMIMKTFQARLASAEHR